MYDDLAPERPFPGGLRGFVFLWTAQHERVEFRGGEG